MRQLHSKNNNLRAEYLQPGYVRHLVCSSVDVNKTDETCVWMCKRAAVVWFDLTFSSAPLHSAVAAPLKHCWAVTALQSEPPRAKIFWLKSSWQRLFVWCPLIWAAKLRLFNFSQRELETKKKKKKKISLRKTQKAFRKQNQIYNNHLLANNYQSHKKIR